MDAGLDDVLFWGTLAFALAVAFVVTVPVNRWMIGRGKGHAVVHAVPRALSPIRRERAGTRVPARAPGWI